MYLLVMLLLPVAVETGLTLIISIISVVPGGCDSLVCAGCDTLEETSAYQRQEGNLKAGALQGGAVCAPPQGAGAEAGERLHSSPCSQFAGLAAMAKWALFAYQKTIFCECSTNDALCVPQGHGVMLGGCC